MKSNNLKSPSISIQAVIAVLMIQLVHKIVREIPGAIRTNEKFGIFFLSFLATVTVASIIFLFRRKKVGLILGMFPAVWACLQWVLVHVIKGHPDPNGIWWYPIFPITQGVLIMYFSLHMLRNENKLNNDRQKPMPWFAFKVMTFIMTLKKKYRNIEEEVNLAGIKSGDYILDFGCGLGFNVIPAAQKVGNNGKVFALDINSQAIKIVEQKSKKNNLKNIETILFDCNTNLEDRSIDIVYLHNTLPLVKDKQGVLIEINRVLKIGGRLSYMSRSVSRVVGEDSISDERLKNTLEADDKFKLITEKNGHLIFEKLEEKNAYRDRE
jgi:ubiquinone/menaquinone biosynthesis C-methylase UbiE